MPFGLFNLIVVKRTTIERKTLFTGCIQLFIARRSDFISKNAFSIVHDAISPGGASVPKPAGGAVTPQPVAVSIHPPQFGAELACGTGCTPQASDSHAPAWRAQVHV